MIQTLKLEKLRFENDFNIQQQFLGENICFRLQLHKPIDLSNNCIFKTSSFLGICARRYDGIGKDPRPKIPGKPQLDE